MPESAPELDVPACVARVISGDQEAAVALMHHLNPLVLKLVRSHLPRRSAEEDLVQTVFLKIFSRLNQFSGSVPNGCTHTGAAPWNLMARHAKLLAGTLPRLVPSNEL